MLLVLLACHGWAGLGNLGDRSHRGGSLCELTAEASAGMPGWAVRISCWTRQSTSRWQAALGVLGLTRAARPSSWQIHPLLAFSPSSCRSIPSDCLSPSRAWICLERGHDHGISIIGFPNAPADGAQAYLPILGNDQLCSCCSQRR